MRVDPHLIGLAIMDMVELNRLRKFSHHASQTRSWCANIGTPDTLVQNKLTTIAPLYASVSGGGFGNLTGDALEVITFKCIKLISERNPRYAYHGHFFLEQPKSSGRFKKTQPPKNICGGTTQKEADFIIYGYDEGPLCVECKNLREWLYPRDVLIKELIIKSYELGAIPIMIDRRIHYTTRSNFLIPAGIIAHESYFQYYPSDQSELAEKVKHKRLLGFTDVRATEEPDKRTVRFFEDNLPKIISLMAQKWKLNRNALYDFAKEEINLSQLYTAISSPAGGKWADAAGGEDDQQPDF
jgi:hypothetical protein